MPPDTAAVRGKRLNYIETVALAHTSDDCLPWPFSTFDTGYGALTIKGRSLGAHRYICERAHGSPPTAIHQAAHSCGNGNQGCVNPLHLYWATPKQNQRDRRAHGTDSRGEKSGLAKLTPDQVRSIRAECTVRKQAEIAAIYGITQAAVSLIHRRKTWGHLQ